MAPLNSSELQALVIGVVATAALAVAAFYVLRLLRRRQAASRLGGAPRPEFASDRAYNRLAMARREADVLEAQGWEVGRARDLIGLADTSFRAREFDRAFELAQSAHETLVAQRKQPAPSGGRSGPAPSTPRGNDSPARPAARAAVDLTRAPEPAVPAPPPAAGLPKNKLESQFQLRLLESDLVARAGTPAAAEVRPLFEQGQAAFAGGEFTEALRLALKGRRQLGGAVETLGPSSPPSTGASPTAPPGTPIEPQGVAERVAASHRCGNCGYPIQTGDTFCRGCGQPLGSAGCPQCGAKRLPADTFCGRCGLRFA